MVAFSEMEDHRGEPRFFRGDGDKFSLRHGEFKTLWASERQC